MGRCVLRPLPRRGHLPTRPIAAGFFGPAGGSAKPARSGRIGIARVCPILSFAFHPIGVAATAETQGARADSYARFPNRGRRQILSALFHAPVIGHPPAISKRAARENRVVCEIAENQDAFEIGVFREMRQIREIKICILPAPVLGEMAVAECVRQLNQDDFICQASPNKKPPGGRAASKEREAEKVYWQKSLCRTDFRNAVRSCRVLFILSWTSGVIVLPCLANNSAMFSMRYSSPGQSR